MTRDGTAEPVSRDRIRRHERGQRNIHFSCSADHVQDGQPRPVGPYFCYMCDHTQYVGADLTHGLTVGIMTLSPSGGYGKPSLTVTTFNTLETISVSG